MTTQKLSFFFLVVCKKSTRT